MPKIRNTHHAIRNTKTAFTLIELIMVIAIVGVLVSLGAHITFELIDSFTYSLYRKELSESADVALRRMSREIRRLQDDTSVYTANSTTYRFVDIDGNTVQFQLDAANSELERYDGTNTDVLAADVSFFSFTYLDGDLATIATPQVNPSATDIKSIQIDMTLSSGTNTVDCDTRIRLRNIPQLSDLFT